VCIYVSVGKNLTKSTFLDYIKNMSLSRKQEYYLNNREKRLRYQREYYHRNKDWIKRKKELKEAEDPDIPLRQKEYNKKYYINNKERIKKQRRNRRLKLKSERSDNL